MPPASGGRPPAKPDGGRPEREPARPGLKRRADEPPAPTDVDIRVLPRAVRAELRGLPKELAEIVAAHLVVAGRLVEDDPEAAYRHAEAARRRAARLPIVREAAAETAYAAGRYDVALAELRALRRMSGRDDYLPVMADCERALGRPEAALALAKESSRVRLALPEQVEMRIVESGARADLGQAAEARRLLKAALDGLSSTEGRGRVPALRLRYAYAERLLGDGDREAARRWFRAAADLDTDFDTDAAERADELDGVVLSIDPDGLYEPGGAAEGRPAEAPPDESAHG